MNNIVDNRDYGAEVIRRARIDARNNWWGSPLGPSRTDFQLRGDRIWTRMGTCLSYPWLTAPVPDAGVIDIR